MPHWANKRTIARLAWLAAGTAAIAVALPALGQERPESLLPPGFGDTPAAPPPAAPPASTPAAVPETAPAVGAVAPGADPFANEAAPEEAEAEPEAFELPDAARRPIDIAGPLAPQDGGFGADAFGSADGRYLSRLMRRLDVPVASRWASITLRRALLSRVPTPRNAAAPDWIAERAWLLLRMGEADAARMLVQTVDVDRFSPRLRAVAEQVALATADPAGLCPLTAGADGNETRWLLARAMCASLSGESAQATALVDRVRSRDSGIDTLLAEKIVGAGTNTRRAVNIEWLGVDRLTPWRFGLAQAAGVTIPAPLLAGAGRPILAWQARAPMLSAEARIAPARTAATLGVFSSQALVDAYAALAESEGDVARDAIEAQLRAAYVEEDASARMAALRAIWDAATEPADKHAALILTARAAAGIAPSSDWAADAARLIGAMMGAGLDRQAARWGAVAEPDDAAWALLAVGAPRPVVDLGYGRIDLFGSRASAERARLLIAALGGLGRLSAPDEARLAARYALPIAASNSWTRAIDTAASRNQPGTVALLAAIGMQTRGWQGVPAIHLYHIVSALRRTGQEPAARMIAAEALSRT